MRGGLEQAGLDVAQAFPVVVSGGPGRRDGGRNLCGRPGWGDRRRPSDRRDCGGSPRAGHWPIRMSRVEDVANPVCPNNRGAWRDRPKSSSGLANQGYDHQPRSISASDPAHIVMPRVHRSLLDRWWLDPPWCHRCRTTISTRMIQSPPFQARGLLFFRLEKHEPVPYKGLVGGHRASETKCRGYESDSAFQLTRNYQHVRPIWTTSTFFMIKVAGRPG